MIKHGRAESGDPASQGHDTSETQTRRRVSRYRKGVATVTTEKTPHLRQGGNTTADKALELIGDDPHTLALAIQLMDRMLARRSKKSTK